MQLQIQSLDLFENLLRVSFAETNDENNDREAQESTINQIIGNKQMADYNRYVVDFEEDIEEEKTLCERLNDPYYSLNMMRQHLHFFCEKEKRKVRESLKTMIIKKFKLESSFERTTTKIHCAVGIETLAREKCKM